MLTLYRYQVTLQILKPVIFTHFPGFHLRNALVSALTVHCRDEKRKKGRMVIGCQGCRFMERCTYFALNLPVDKPDGVPRIMPFMLHPETVVTGKYEQGFLSFGITLFGTANRHERKIAHAFFSAGMELGIGENKEPGSFTLVSMELTDEYSLHSAFNFRNPSDESAAHFSDATLRFIHYRPPQNRLELAVRLPFAYFVQTVTDRLNELEKVYGEPDEIGVATAPSPELIPEPATVEHFSKCNYQYPGTGMGYWFLSGTVQYKGLSEPFNDLLILGSRIGIGSLTAAGFGRYTLNHAAPL